MDVLDTVTVEELMAELERRFQAFIFHGTMTPTPDHLETMRVPRDKAHLIHSTSMRWGKGCVYEQVGLAEGLKFDIMGQRMVTDEGCEE